jgi:hypothetical protein
MSKSHIKGSLELVSSLKKELEGFQDALIEKFRELK